MGAQIEIGRTEVTLNSLLPITLQLIDLSQLLLGLHEVGRHGDYLAIGQSRLIEIALPLADVAQSEHNFRIFEIKLQGVAELALRLIPAFQFNEELPQMEDGVRVIIIDD